MIKASRAKNLVGEVKIPGDKSISHRAIIFGSLCIGKTIIKGLLESNDVCRTIEAVKQFGAKVKKRDGTWEVDGFGVGGFSSPLNVIDCGNSGTTCRLLIGAVSTTAVTATFVGDKSLSQRPMDRIMEPLSRLGAKFIARDNSFLPITVQGVSTPTPNSFYSKVDSAQVKSAILLAGLNSRGKTSYTEKVLTRDHTERMMKAFGVDVQSKKLDSYHLHCVQGSSELIPQEIVVPSDPSSASFFIAVALMVEGSDLILRNICINETRTGFLKVIRMMGAKISFFNERTVCGELVSDLRVRYSKLKGVVVPKNLVASMIDEFPILSVLASVAEGETKMENIQELRVKESDRIFSMTSGLIKCGVNVEYGDDFMIVKGNAEIIGGQQINTFNDHRVAMSFICLGQVCQRHIEINEVNSITTSFPSFVTQLKEIGANLEKN